MEVKGYRIHHKVGRGGMGKVYKATHITSGKLVAIKVLESTENKRRFENEARLQANISHPNICRIYGYGEESGRPYIVMEYIEGQSLEAFLKGRPSMDLRSRLSIFRDICSALGHLHSYSIIHRDVKPENIKITSQGEVKLIDFGIAKGISTPRLTGTGQIIGTLQYIAPERFKNQCTAASDVWSLGVILYRICTGAYPFSGDDTRKLQLAIRKASYLEITRVNPDLSKRLKLIVDRCLQQKVSKRYEDANALLEDFDNYLSGEPRKRFNLENTRQFLSGKHRRPVAVTGILLVIAVIFIVLAGSNSGNSNEMTGVVCITVQNAQNFKVFVNGKRCGTDCDCPVQLNTKAVVRVQATGYKTFEDEINIYKKRSYMTASMERK